MRWETLPACCDSACSGLYPGPSICYCPCTCAAITIRDPPVAVATLLEAFVSPLVPCIRYLLMSRPQPHAPPQPRATHQRRHRHQPHPRVPSPAVHVFRKPHLGASDTCDGDIPRRATKTTALSTTWPRPTWSLASRAPCKSLPFIQPVILPTLAYPPKLGLLQPDQPEQSTRLSRPTVLLRRPSRPSRSTRSCRLSCTGYCRWSSSRVRDSRREGRIPRPQARRRAPLPSVQTIAPRQTECSASLSTRTWRA